MGKLMLTTDMADTAVDTDTEVMVDTVEVMEVTDMVDTVASDLPLLKLTPTLKPKLTVDTVDTVDTVVDTVDMVDTVVDMVDTVARGPLIQMLRLTMVDTMVVTAVDTEVMVDTAVDTEAMVDTVMAVEVTTDRFY